MAKCMYCGEPADEKSLVCPACEQAAIDLEKNAEAKEGFDYKEWYERNKEEVARRRKKRYDNDKEYREKKKLESSRFYWLKQRRAKSIGLNQADFEELDLEPSGTIDIVVTNENDIRYGMELTIPLFRPSQVAAVLRRTTQTLRLWFTNGTLKDRFIRSAQGYRMFTEDQLRVFIENRHWLSFSVQDFKQHPFFSLVEEKLDELEPDGIVPMLKDEWRLDPSNCPICGKAPSLQHKVDGKWKPVSCFSCKEPSDVYGRAYMQLYYVSGTCDFCGNLVDDEVQAVEGKDPIVICQKCGRRVARYKKELKE